jgi:hypothetical protein
MALSTQFHDGFDQAQDFLLTLPLKDYGVGVNSPQTCAAEVVTDLDLLATDDRMGLAIAAHDRLQHQSWLGAIRLRFRAQGSGRLGRIEGRVGARAAGQQQN